jgi:hypothetical protein
VGVGGVGDVDGERLVEADGGRTDGLPVKPAVRCERLLVREKREGKGEEGRNNRKF